MSPKGRPISGGRFKQAVLPTETRKSQEAAKKRKAGLTENSVDYSYKMKLRSKADDGPRKKYAVEGARKADGKQGRETMSPSAGKNRRLGK